MTLVIQLQPGDQVEIPGPGDGVATFVARTDHPLYPGFQLVIWKMPPGHPLGLEWSHDALSAYQDVGQVKETTMEERLQSLRKALIPGG